jgi:type I restriction enzyme, S subunit
MSAKARPGQGWRTYRFDEIATNVNERVDDPSEAGVEYYVGLEHLDSDSLTIRRWGSPTDVQATKLKFRKGDIIFGRRRVYQRKLGVADFDGICSAHAMVLRAKPGALWPEFLPFFMQSDLFMERAKEISVGSLSPTINWPALAREEFALPPLDEQRRIAEALKTTQAAIEAQRNTGVVLKTLIDNWLQVRLASLNHREVLDDILLTTEYGCSAYSGVEAVGTPILRIPNVLRDELDLSDLKWVELSVSDTAKYSLRPGDILMVRTNGNPAYVGRCLVVPHLDRAMVFASYLIRLVVDPAKARPEFVASILNAPTARRLLRSAAKSSAGNFNINTKGIRGVAIPIPSLSEQDALLSELSTIRRGHSSLLQRVSELGVLQQRLLDGFQR